VGDVDMGSIAAMAEQLLIQTETVGAVPFSHGIHGAQCDRCHPNIFKKKNNSNHVTMKMMETGRSCGACHDGREAFSVTANCTTCHAGDVAINTNKVGVVTFSHDVHTDMFGCAECHPDLFKPLNNSNHATMKQMEKGESCGACHDGDTAFGVSGDCTTCHSVGDVSIKTRKVGKVTFSHEIHTGMFACSECHPGIFKAKRNSNHTTMKEMYKGESCGSCHDGSSAFGVKEDCTVCHAGDIVFKEEDAGNVTFPHAAHIDMYGCEDCHPRLFRPQQGRNKATMEDMEKGKSCGACHDGDTAFSVAEDCESCHQM